MGIWKNVSELEEALSLPELELIVTSARDKEDRANRWLAAVNGIDLNKEQEVDAKEKVEEMKRRIEARQKGQSDEEFEFNELGLDIEVEE